MSTAEAHRPLPHFEANHSKYFVRKVFKKNKINNDMTQRKGKVCSQTVAQNLRGEK